MTEGMQSVVEVDPAIQEEFDRNSAEFEARSAAVTDELTARRREIGQRLKEANEKAAAEREQIMTQVKELAEKEKPGQAEPQRPVNTWPDADRSGADRVLSFGVEDDEPAPVRQPPPAVPRRRAPRAEQDDEDYSGESWLR